MLFQIPLLRFPCNISRCNSLQKEKGRIVQDFEQNIQTLQSKYDDDIDLLKQEHALSAVKVSSHSRIG